MNGNECISNTAFVYGHCRLQQQHTPGDSNGNRPYVVVDVLSGDSACPAGVAFGVIGPDASVDPDVLPAGVDAELPGDRMLLYDAIEQLPLLQNRTSRMPAQFDDLRIMARLVYCGEERSTDLGQLVERELQVPAEEVRRMKHGEFGEHLELMARCYPKLLGALESMGLLDVYALELDVARIVADAGGVAIEIDNEALSNVFLASTMLGHFVEDQTGKCIDIGNERQLASVLYGHDNWPDDHEAKRAVAPEQLMRLAQSGNIVAQEMLKFPLVSKEARSILRRMQCAGQLQLDPLGTVVGGFTVDPSINAVPKNPAIRKCLLTPEGCQFIQIDMRQQGTRVLAALAGDDVFLDAIKRGQDLHALTASLITRRQYDQVTSTERATGKHVNLAVANGQQATGLASALNMPIHAAGEVLEKFNSVHPAIARFQRKVVEIARAQGCAVTRLGRVRLLPDAMGTGEQASRAQCQALNFVIAGTANDALKTNLVAMMKSVPCQLLMVDQDSILIAVAENQVSSTAVVIADVFARPIPWLGIALDVVIKVGPNWGEMRLQEHL